jgi:hypothetical protein
VGGTIIVVIPTERWFVVLGVALGLYGSVVAGAGGAGHLAHRVTEALGRWIGQHLRQLYGEVRARLGGARHRNVQLTDAGLGFDALLTATSRVEVAFPVWPITGAPAEQIAALLDRTDTLQTRVNLHIREIEALRADGRALSGRVDALAAQTSGELHDAMVKIEARSMQVNAAGLPGIALSIVLTGVSWLFASPTWWAWCALAGFVALAIIHVAWTWRGALSAIRDGWVSEPDMAAT